MEVIQKGKCIELNIRFYCTLLLLLLFVEQQRKDPNPKATNVRYYSNVKVNSRHRRRRKKRAKESMKTNLREYESSFSFPSNIRKR